MCVLVFIFVVFPADVPVLILCLLLAGVVASVCLLVTRDVLATQVFGSQLAASSHGAWNVSLVRPIKLQRNRSEVSMSRFGKSRCGLGRAFSSDKVVLPAHSVFYDPRDCGVSV